MGWRVSCTNFRGAAKSPPKEPSGWRSSQCITARPSVLLIGSPRNMASRCEAKPVWRANSINKASVATSVWFLDRSAKTWGAVWLRADARSASCAKAVRKSKAAACAAWVVKAFQAGVWSQRMRTFKQTSGYRNRGHFLSEPTPVGDSGERRSRVIAHGVRSYVERCQAFFINSSSFTASAQKARMPSASFSVAMASSFRASRNEASS